MLQALWRDSMNYWKELLPGLLAFLPTRHSHGGIQARAIPTMACCVAGSHSETASVVLGATHRPHHWPLGAHHELGCVPTLPRFMCVSPNP